MARSHAWPGPVVGSVAAGVGLGVGDAGVDVVGAGVADMVGDAAGDVGATVVVGGVELVGELGDDGPLSVGAASTAVVSGTVTANVMTMSTATAATVAPATVLMVVWAIPEATSACPYALSVGTNLPGAAFTKVSHRRRGRCLQRCGLRVQSGLDFNHESGHVWAVRADRGDCCRQRLRHFGLG